MNIEIFWKVTKLVTYTDISSAWKAKVHCVLSSGVTGPYRYFEKAVIH